MKNVIFILPALWMGGIEQALGNLLHGLEGKDYDLTCLILTGDTRLAYRLPESCRLIVADRERYPYSWLYHLTEKPTAPSLRHRLFLWTVPVLKWVEAWLFAWYVGHLLAGEVFDTAVIYSSAAAQTALRAVRAKKWLLCLHHGSLHRIPADRRVWRKCAWVIGVSEPLWSEWRKFRPQYAGKITHIPNLTDGNWIKQQAKQFDPGFSPEEFHIVCVGRLHRDKGMDLAVSAAGILRDLPLHWWIIGDGWEMPRLEKQIRELGLSHRVSLLGLRDNPFPYMASADLYLQPSRKEGFGLSIAEARILGKPVLATDTLGARVQLPPGCLCEISARAIADRVAAFLEDPFPATAWDWEAENAAALQKWEALL